MKTAIITGASSGIGKAIAYELAKEKYNLLLIARRENLLSEICKELSKNYNIKAHYIVMDLSKNNDFSFIKNYFLENFDSIDVLVNNVGIGYYGEIEKISVEDVEKILKVGGVDRILLDNFNINDLKRAVDLIGERFEVEASGGITLENVREVAETGVDYISVGMLTHSVRALDISLEIKV